MKHVEQNAMDDLRDLMQLSLWLDDEMPEVQDSERVESQGVQSLPPLGDPSATQLYLPGFEPK